MNILATISHFLFSLIFQYRYFFLFPVTVVEGPLITMASGFMVSLGLMNPFIALPIIVLGDVTSDLIYYAVGRYGDRWKWTRAIIRYFHFDQYKERATRAFEKHGGKVLLLGKFTHAFGAVFLIGAGYSEMDVVSFTWYSLLGTAIKSGILMYVGYLAGSAYALYASKFEYWSVVVSLGVVALTVCSLFVIKRINTRSLEDDYPL